MYDKLLADPQLAPFFVGTDLGELVKHQARRPRSVLSGVVDICAGSTAAQGHSCMRVPGALFRPGHSGACTSSLLVCPDQTHVLALLHGLSALLHVQAVRVPAWSA